jgi:hypothetical protein
MLNKTDKSDCMNTGELTYVEFGKKFQMVECDSTQMMYMGHAVKMASMPELPVLLCQSDEYPH